MKMARFKALKKLKNLHNCQPSLCPFSPPKDRVNQQNAARQALLKAECQKLPRPQDNFLSTTSFILNNRGKPVFQNQTVMDKQVL